MTMEILTLYAGQGNLAVVRHGGQANRSGYSATGGTFRRHCVEGGPIPQKTGIGWDRSDGIR